MKLEQLKTLFNYLPSETYGITIRHKVGSGVFNALAEIANDKDMPILNFFCSMADEFDLVDLKNEIEINRNKPIMVIVDDFGRNPNEKMNRELWHLWCDSYELFAPGSRIIYLIPDDTEMPEGIDYAMLDKMIHYRVE